MVGGLGLVLSDGALEEVGDQRLVTAHQRGSGILIG